MKNNRFFNPSPLYKEFMLLDVIEKYDSITQRDMSSFINGSISMVNEYLTKYEKLHYIERDYLTKKTVKYTITKAGLERKKLLNLWFLSDSHKIYIFAKENILDFFRQKQLLQSDGVYLYGAGDMADIILDLVTRDNSFQWNILGIIDDDTEKIGQKHKGLSVVSFETALQHDFSHIVISSYNHNTKIYESTSLKVEESKIVSFFR